MKVSWKVAMKKLMKDISFEVDVHYSKKFHELYNDLPFLAEAKKVHKIKEHVPSKHLLVFKTSWRYLQQVFCITIFCLPRCLEDLLEDENFLRCRRLQDVFLTCLEYVFKTSWRQTKCLLGIFVSNKSIFHRSLSDKYKANPKNIN